MPFTKGDIVRGKNTVHPIIYLSELDEHTFKACIITHANNEKYPDNKKLKQEHFKTIDVNGNKFEIIFNDTFFISKHLIKRSEWGPYIKKGELTQEGIEYIEQLLKNEETIPW